MHALVQDTTVPAELCGFSIPAFSKRLGVSRSHGWQLVRDGKVKTVRLGRRRIIPSSELSRILQEGA